MDTTEQYIKMCEKAEEVQEGREEMTERDFYFHDVCLHCFSIEDYCPNPYYMHTCSSCGFKGVQHKDLGFVWLPRQDQLQEMVEYVSPLHLLEYINNFVMTITTGTNPAFFTSMEQLWLAFVMKEKYGKIWDGDKWIKQ